MRYSKEALIRIVKFTEKELKLINNRRREHNNLGFAYQLAYVKLHNRLPIQQPLEIIEELIQYVSLQISLDAKSISKYTTRQATISKHQEQITRAFLREQKILKPAESTLRRLIQQDEKAYPTRATKI